jgi:hypothetical protein
VREREERIEAGDREDEEVEVDADERDDSV